MDFAALRLHKLVGMWFRFLAEADWLTAKRVRAYLWILALVNVATVAALIATSHNGVDRNGFLLGTDFLSFWTVGQMLGHHADVYDQAAHIAAQQAYFAQPGAFTAFFYPPTMLPFCWPLGRLPYFPALGSWLVATGAVFAFAVKQWLRQRMIPAPVWLLMLAFPACVIEITHGQTAFLVGGLLLLAALWVPQRPWFAGFLFGLATIKPQFGLLVPLVLVLTGEWRVIAAAVASALALAGLSTVLFGSNVWSDWYALTRAAQAAMDSGTVGYVKMVSPFAGAMLLGMSRTTSYILQAVVSAVIVLMLARVSWRKSYTSDLAALMLAGATLVTPFVLDYDLVLMAPALMAIVANGLRAGFAPWEKLLAFLAFAAPAFARPIGMNLHLPIVPAISFLLFFVLWRRLCAPALPPERQLNA